MRALGCALGLGFVTSSHPISDSAALAAKRAAVLPVSSQQAQVRCPSPLELSACAHAHTHTHTHTHSFLGNFVTLTETWHSYLEDGEAEALGVKVTVTVSR